MAESATTGRKGPGSAVGFASVVGFAVGTAVGFAVETAMGTLDRRSWRTGGTGAEVDTGSGFASF